MKRLYLLFLGILTVFAMPVLAQVSAADKPLSPPLAEETTPQLSQVVLTQAPQADKPPPRPPEKRQSPETIPEERQSPEMIDVEAQPAETTSSLPLRRAPNMLGDANGGACGAATFGGTVTARLDHPTLFCNQIKIADNSSPMPQDRVLFTYQLFNNATHLSLSALDPPVEKDLSIHRYVFGLEKTYLDKKASIQVLLPLNTQLANDVTFLESGPSITSDTTTSLGNLAVALKGLLYSSCTFRLSGGLLMQFPTAPDVTLRERGFHELTKEAVAQILPGSPELQALVQSLGLPLGNFPFSVDNSLHFRNQSVILSPFLGWLHTPNDRWFTQGFLQFDFDASGSQVTVTPRFQAFAPGGITQRIRELQPFTDIAPEAFTPTGVSIPTAAIAGPFGLATSPQSRRLYQQVLMRVDVGTGYWVYQNPCAQWLTGLAPTIEAHYTTTLTDAKLADFHLVGSPQTPFQTDLKIGNVANRLDIMNLVLGCTAEFSTRSTLAFGYAIPLSTGDNKPFDYEVNVQLNYRF